jgi:serine/threonine protein phosphatase PrpC
MAQKHQLAAWSTCPSCEEPLESGDLFCGACGHELSAAPAAPDDHPTIAIAAQAAARSGPGAPAAPSAGDGASPVEWPAVQDGAEAAAVQLPGELPGLDSAGTPLHLGDFELPAPGRSGSSGGHPADAPASGARPSAVRGEPGRPPGPATPGGRPGSPVSDPRTAVPDVPAAGTPVCVACRSGRVDPDGYCENCGHAQPRDRDHVEQELDAVAAVTDRGLRHHRNEDAFAVSAAAGPDGSPAVIAIVCDGVSSATRPDEASAAAAAAANESLLAALPRGTHPQQAMHDAIVTAAQAVDSLAQTPDGAREHSHHQQNAPACTIVATVATGGLLVVGWIGDSRAYWVPDDREGPARLTEDDSWAAQMVTAGLMNEAEAYADERAHAITGWLGADAYELEPHTASFKPDRPGVVVVCTDGLWNYAEGVREMAGVVPADAAQRPLHAAQVLVGHALDGGGHDNVTVAVVPFAGTTAGAGSAYGKA